MSKNTLNMNASDDQLTIHEAKLSDVGYGNHSVKNFSDILLMTAYFNNKEKKNGKIYIGGIKK